ATGAGGARKGGEGACGRDHADRAVAIVGDVGGSGGQRGNRCGTRGADVVEAISVWKASEAGRGALTVDAAGRLLGPGERGDDAGADQLNGRIVCDVDVLIKIEPQAGEHTRGGYKLHRRCRSGGVDGLDCADCSARVPHVEQGEIRGEALNAAERRREGAHRGARVNAPDRRAEVVGHVNVVRGV